MRNIALLVRKYKGFYIVNVSTGTTVSINKIASIIAKKINLKQTYKAFHYITLAYIPITLLSLCVFKLIGPYFSIGCEGSSLYLSICSFIVCAIIL